MYFAGEATQTSSLVRSTVCGAWLSGIRAAEEIARANNIDVITPTYDTFMDYIY
jgi:hypothetical protein